MVPWVFGADLFPLAEPLGSPRSGGVQLRTAQQLLIIAEEEVNAVAPRLYT
jgi:hypothetical protein